MLHVYDIQYHILLEQFVLTKWSQSTFKNTTKRSKGWR